MHHGGESRKRLTALLAAALLLVGLLPSVAVGDKLKDTAIDMGDYRAAYGEVVTLRSWLYRPYSNDDEKYLSGRTVTYRINDGLAGTAVTNPSGFNQNKEELYGLSELPFLVQLPPGVYVVEARFDGDAKFAPTVKLSRLVVDGPARTATTLETVNVSGTPGSLVPLTAWLKDRAGNPLPEQPVMFSVGSTAVGSAVTDQAGVARLTYSAGALTGTFPVQAAFAGNETYLPASAGATLSIAAAPKTATSLTLQNAAGNPGTTVMLQASLKDQNGLGLTGQLVTFQVDGVTVGTGTTAGGLVQVPYQISQTATGGTHTLTAVFAGDDRYTAVQQSGTLQVVVAKPTFIAIGNAYGQTGDTIILRSWLQGDGQYLSGETVEYYVDGALVGSAVTNPNQAALPGTALYGQAELLYFVNLPPGTYQLKARFAGNVYFKECIQVMTLEVY